MTQDQTPRIVVLGATGYAGGLAVDALLERGVRPVLAGTRRPALEALAARHGGLEHRLADAQDLDSVKALVRSGDVLVTTVGPFDRLGRVVARAAAEQGAHYVDSTGEVGFVRDLIDDLDEVARGNGSVMLPAFGYDYVPGLLAGALAAREAGDGLHSLDVGYLVRGGFDGGKGLSKGTRTTFVEQMGRPAFVYVDGRLGRERMASRTMEFELDGTPKDAVLAGGTEVLTLPSHDPRVQDVRVYNGWFPRLAWALQAVSAGAWLVERTALGRRLVDVAATRLTGPPGGPGPRERARAAGAAAGVARHAGGRVLASVTLVGPNPYDLTADLMAWAADELARGRGRRPGVVDAIDAFGLDESVAAAASMGLRREA